MVAWLPLLMIAFSRFPPFPRLPVPPSFFYFFFFSLKPWQKLVGKSDYGARRGARETRYSLSRNARLAPGRRPSLEWGFQRPGVALLKHAERWRQISGVEMAQMVALIMMMMNLHFGKRRREWGGYFVSSSVSDSLWMEDKHFTINHC